MIVKKIVKSAPYLAGVALALGIARADVGSLAVSSDYDAELARAADLLESGQRLEAERILSEVRRRAGQRAWDARADFLLALDDERRKDFLAAAQRLESSPALSIGLDSYRRDRLARNLAASERLEEARSEYEALEKSEEPYAGRTRTALDFAGLLEKSGATPAAAAVLARAAAASPAASLELAPERLRLALRLNDGAAIGSLSRQLLLESPVSDRAVAIPAEVRRALARRERTLSAADRARRGRSLIASGDAARGVALLSRDPASRWPLEERNANLLALARGQERLGRRAAALTTAARVPQDDGAASFEARLLEASLELARLRKESPEASPGDPRREGLAKRFAALAVPAAPLAVRSSARERLILLALDAEDFEAGFEQARALVAESAGTRAGFEPLWKLAWGRYRAGDCAGARGRFEALASLYAPVDLRRRLFYWRARCLEREGDRPRASAIFRALSAGDPPDLYALFACQRADPPPSVRRPALPDPSMATATFRRVDELLRLRLFAEASAEARLLPASRGRELRLAESEFALGRFAAAAVAAKRAFPEMGTAEENRVPDGWRRLYYPIEEGGFLAERAREFQLDPALLRGLVRQESLFEAKARSRAGALGLTQLLPSTARSVARSVLRVRYRRAFLYDPGVNARLGAAYLRRLYDRFGENPLWALAAYNGGPARVAGLLEGNPGLEEDELFESHPAHESRDYVRRVLLFAESYRQLYPPAPLPNTEPPRGALDAPSSRPSG
ncbi:MAG: transglycosylase SLT domain-containing protein [Thermoanaerobaculia bacterium]